MKYSLPLLVACATIAAWNEDATGDCDLAFVVDGFYCARDDATLVKKELVSKRTYYECSGCGAFTLRKGNCETCSVPLERRVSEAGVCEQCLTKPHPREVCEKKYYECDQCGSVAKKSSKCKPCGAKRKRAVSRALVEYSCGGCGTISPAGATCEDPDCDDFGTPMVQRCTGSGESPHVTA